MLLSFRPQQRNDPLITLPIRTPADRLMMIVSAINAALEQRRPLVADGKLRLLANLVSRWLQPVFNRVIAFANAAAAGTLLPPAPRGEAAARSRTQRTRTDRPRLHERLPGRLRWLAVLLGSDGAAIALQFRDFLADPETAAFLATAPRMGPTLRPLCRALGVAEIAAIRLTRRKRQRRAAAEQRAPRPEPEPLPVLPEPYKPPPIPPQWTFTPTDPGPTMKERVDRWLERQERERRWAARWREI